MNALALAITCLQHILLLVTTMLQTHAALVHHRDSISKRSANCPAPYKEVSGLCLLFGDFSERMTWLEARSNCMTSGGDLVWIENRAQHRKVLLFLRQECRKGFVYYVHVGLYRITMQTPLVWVRNPENTYRGDAVDYSNRRYFAMSSGEYRFSGVRLNEQYRYICRR